MEGIFLFTKLSEEEQHANGLKKSSTRLDCTRYYAGDPYKGFEPFTNKKGMLFLYILNKPSNGSDKRPDLSLGGNNSLNFTGLFPTEDNDIFFGYPYGLPRLRNGLPNPTFDNRGDLYIIRQKNSFESFEVYVFKDCKNLAQEYVNAFINGDFEDDINVMKQKAKPYYNYAKPPKNV